MRWLSRSHLLVPDDWLSDLALCTACNSKRRPPEGPRRVHTESLRDCLKIAVVLSTIWPCTRPHLLRRCGYEERPPTHRSAISLAERVAWTVTDNGGGNTNSQTTPKDTPLILVGKVPQRQMYRMFEERHRVTVRIGSGDHIRWQHRPLRLQRCL